jgi:hypothetical protein
MYGTRGGNVRHCRDVVYIGLIDHRRHRLLHIPLPKLILRMFFPHGLEIKPRPIQLPFQEPQTPGMRDARTPLMIIFVRGQDPA